MENKEKILARNYISNLVKMKVKERNSSKESIKEFISRDELNEKFQNVLPLFKELLIQLTDYEILRTKEDVITFLNFIFCEDTVYVRELSHGIIMKESGNIMLEVPKYDYKKKQIVQPKKEIIFKFRSDDSTAFNTAKITITKDADGNIIPAYTALRQYVTLKNYTHLLKEFEISKHADSTFTNIVTSLIEKGIIISKYEFNDLVEFLKNKEETIGQIEGVEFIKEEHGPNGEITVAVRLSQDGSLLMGFVYYNLDGTLTAPHNTSFGYNSSENQTIYYDEFNLSKEGL